MQPTHLPSPYYGLMRCIHCGHYQIEIGSTPSDNEEIQLKYFDKNFASRAGYFISHYEGINSRRTVRLLKLKRPTNILEVGPGSGMVMSQLKKIGHNVTGLDISNAVAKNIESRYGLTVVTNSLAEHEESARNVYGAVIMRHVLEHFSDPLKSMKVVCNLLQEGGKLYLAVPNMDSWHIIWRGWTGYEPYHIQYFTRKSIVKCLESSGFKILQIGSYESQSGWVNTFIKSVKTPSTSTTESNMDSGGGRARKIMECARLLFGLIITPVRWVQSLIGRGEELFVVAERRSN